VRLPEIQLDDRRFQDLVSEARLKITRSCPEWTEHNVSDPGITLIELFAWMTEMTIYRLNRVPDKLTSRCSSSWASGWTARAPRRRTCASGSPSRRARRCWSRAGARRSARRGPPRRSRSSSRSTRLHDPGDSGRGLRAPARRAGQNVGLADGVAKPSGADQLAFASPPAVGDAIYLGFEEPLGRLLIEVDVDASQARGAGVNPDDPPLRWEVSQGDGAWLEAEVLEDLTGGFNYGSGTVLVELPPRSAVQPMAGHRLHWLRCRIDDKTRSGSAATTYSQPPEIYSITAAPVGARLPATHAAQISSEILGVSDGTPGQIFPLRNAPVLKPMAGEDARGAGPRVRRLGALGAARRLRGLDRVRPPLQPRPRLRRAGDRARDPGETDGGWTQYGAVPPKGAVLRFTRYRHGGGRLGNVTAGTLTVLRARSRASTP
jgi:hypothetical protein